MSKQIDQPPEKYDSLFGLILRVFWMLFGNAILCVSAVYILHLKGVFFHTADVVFWVTAAALVLARYLDIKFYTSLTATGEPASMTHWRKYAVVLLICSTVIWVLAHIINHIVVNK